MKTLLPRILAAALALAACGRAEARTEAPPRADAPAVSARAETEAGTPAPLAPARSGGMSVAPRTASVAATATAAEDTCAGQDAKPAGQVAEAGVEYGKLCAFPKDSAGTPSHVDPTRLVAQLNAKAHGQQ